MKKILIGVIALGTVFFTGFSAFAAPVSALVSVPIVTGLPNPKWSETKKLVEGLYQEITSWAFTNQKVRVFKFQDDNTVCYVMYMTVANGTLTSPTMSCIRP